MKATLYTIVTVACLVSFIQGCTRQVPIKQEKDIDYICGSNGYYYTQTPQKLEIMKDENGEFLPCTDERIMEF